MPPAFQPRSDDYGFDLDRVLSSVVGLHSIILGQIEILLLLAAIGFTIAGFRRISTLAAWLMTVNFLWVAFAAVLNLAFWLAN